jgi:L-lactate dehydrogenase complex protein LldG
MNSAKNSAKEEILGRIRRAINRPEDTRTSDYEAIQRSYIQAGTCDRDRRIELFSDRLRDYGSGVYRCQPNQIAPCVGYVLSQRGKRRVLVPVGFPEKWLPVKFEVVRDSGLTNQEMNDAENVLTGCALAIASTGTIILRHSPEEGRRALTLIPDYHLCVVFEDQLVETVPEGIRAMSVFGSAPLTTISGPSATSDIEMTRIKGVHGPRTLDVLLVGR